MNRSGIRNSRSSALTLAASALLSVTVLSGCGDSEVDDAVLDATSSATKGSTAASGVKPLTAAELDEAALEKADLTGYVVSTPGDAEAAAVEQAKVTGAECAPLGRAVAGAAVGEPTATAYRRVTGKPAAGASSEKALDFDTGMVTLASYADAEAASAALKTVAACTGGFQLTLQGETQKATKVAADTAPKAGDEAVAYTVTIPAEGTDVPWKVVMFRSGATLAQFTVVNGASAISGKDFTFPADLVTAQAGKLA
ncbi:hypothetical protein ACGFZS_38560 [Streptomyces sp. NPDC048288]|uniref:hypothetical protein n=1 Tax=Streptomyces sp. NPDC048288 TaxID=3365529 RepID=UPI00371CE383